MALSNAHEHSLSGRNARFLHSESWHRKKDLKALLLEDPGLLDDEIWRIFECEPRAGNIQILYTGNADNNVNNTWEQALWS